MEFKFCEPCKLSFNGIIPYQDHLASSKHKKMFQEQVSFPAADSSRSTLVPSCQFSDPFIKPQGKGFWCNLCKLDLNGPDQARAHVAGSKHLKLKLGHPGNCGKDIGSENTKMDVSNIKLNSPQEIFDSYSGFKFSFHGIHIENVLEGVKIFGINDPIEF